MQTLNLSPAQIALSRWTRTSLPIHSNLLMPKQQDPQTGIQKTIANQKKPNYKNTKDLKPLKVGEHVLFDISIPSKNMQNGNVGLWHKHVKILDHT